MKRRLAIVLMVALSPACSPAPHGPAEDEAGPVDVDAPQPADADAADKSNDSSPLDSKDAAELPPTPDDSPEPADAVEEQDEGIADIPQHECDTDKDCSHLVTAPCQAAWCDTATFECKKGPALYGTPCDDGDSCTSGDSCIAGVCKGGENKCSCTSVADCPPDDNLCDGKYACDLGSGKCVNDPTTAVKCDSDPLIVCKKNVCVPPTGKCNTVAANEGDPCDDWDQCTTGDACSGGECKGGPPPACDDGNPCTDDSCAAGLGCVHKENIKPCDDGDQCTEADTCGGGKCTGKQISCDDGNPCTDDSCDKVTGIIHVFNTVPCDDSDPCTVADACSSGQCKGGGSEDCNDADPCTVDSCTAGTGCEHAPLDCADEDPCSEDWCDAALGCQHSAGGACDDGNPCTDDSCDPSTGCSHQEVIGTCPGPNPICLGLCVAGKCVMPVEELNGFDDDCDNDADEDFDLDHDGVCDSDSCPIKAVDKCMTAWSPDNDVAPCAPVGPGWTRSRAITLAQLPIWGAPKWRRTNEPFEVPLRNGFIDDSVIAEWRMEGGSGKDWTGNGNDGVPKNVQPAGGAFGDAGGGAGLDGSAWYSLPKTLKLGPDFTILARFKGVVWGSEQTIFSGFSKPTSGVYLAMGDKARLQFSVETASGAWSDIVSQPLLPVDQWLSVAAVKKSNQMFLYVDGALSSWTLIENGFDGPGGAATPFIGGREGIDPTQEPESRFHGALDDVILIGRALSSDDVIAWHRSNRPYGTDLVPGARPDLDDIRVIETSPQQGEHGIPAEVIGPRPHSTTPCTGQQDATWPDREDLCGVAVYWRLDGDGKDASMNGKDLSPQSPAGAFGRGRFGDAPGSYSPADAGPGKHLHLDAAKVPGPQGGSLTVEAWVLIGSTAGGRIVDHFDGKKGYWIGITGSGKVEAGLGGEAGAQSLLASTRKLLPGAWHHLAAVFEKEDASYLVRLFIDGLEDPESPGSLASSSFDTSCDLAIGSFSSGAGDPFPGRVDEVMIHATAKSPEYLFRRANPGVPAVRFLAQTAAFPAMGGKDHEFLSYTLLWANPAATHPQPLLSGPNGEKCAGLLSKCLGYVAWWRFNEGGEDIAVDSSANKFNGACHGNGFQVTGHDGLARVFDGSTSYVSIPDRPDLSPDNFTIESWARPTEQGTENVIIAKGPAGDPGNHSYKLGLIDSGFPFVFYEYGSGTDVKLKAAKKSPVGGWHFIAATYDGKALLLHETYKDPISVAQPNPPGENDADVMIGADNGPTVFFQGEMDSIRIMSRALSEDEFMHLPPAVWTLEPCSAGGQPDKDCDGVPD